MDKAKKLLRDLGATLKRRKKHLVYELPNGRNVVLASTPSDSYHGEQNKLRDIRHAAGLTVKPAPERTKERRDKPGRRAAEWSLPALSPMAAAIKDSGLADKLAALNLQQELQIADAKIADLRRTVHALETRIAALQGWWPVRLRMWWERD